MHIEMQLMSIDAHWNALNVREVLNQSEGVNGRSTDNAMAKRTNEQKIKQRSTNHCT
jgi:predicted 2-oxoglutarate/Fe(II)-dependent dioxygenase YbiX